MACLSGWSCRLLFYHRTTEWGTILERFRIFGQHTTADIPWTPVAADVLQSELARSLARTHVHFPSAQVCITIATGSRMRHDHIPVGPDG